MNKHKTYDWVKEISPDLKQLDAIPLTGSPPFPWEEFSERLSKAFEREGLTIQPGETVWKKKEELLEGLGDAPYPLTLTIPSLRGEVYWVMPAQEIDLLAALILTKESHPLAFHDPDLTESFYRFLALEILYHLTQTSFDKSLSPVLTHPRSLPDQNALCKDISITVNDHTIWGRLILSPDFRSSWAEHFAHTPILSEEMGRLIETTVHLEAGKCHLTREEWNSIQLGDFILLDSCSLKATDHFSGNVMLTIHDRPAFRAKLKDGTLKILELPFLHEVETPMAKQPEDDDEDFSELDLPEDEFEEEESFDEDLYSDESETEEETPSTEEEGEEPVPVKTETKLFSPEKIPLNIVVEVGRVQMSVEQLMKLEPGNMLDIDLHPEDGVNLTVQGKVIGRGELIRIGEAIGVRVTQLGTSE